MQKRILKTINNVNLDVTTLSLNLSPKRADFELDRIVFEYGTVEEDTVPHE